MGEPRCVCVRRRCAVVNKKNRMPKMPRFRDFGHIPLSFLPSFSLVLVLVFGGHCHLPFRLHCIAKGLLPIYVLHRGTPCKILSSINLIYSHLPHITCVEISHVSTALVPAWLVEEATEVGLSSLLSTRHAALEVTESPYLNQNASASVYVSP